jgi:hypothetical protein
MFTNYHISGYAKYDNNPKTPLEGLKITLKKNGITQGAPVITGPTGYYDFSGLINGIYNIEVASANPGGWLTWGGVNNTDYMMVTKHIKGTQLLPVNPPVIMVTASVKAPHPAINTIDATAIREASKFGWGYFEIPKWVFSGVTSTTRIDTVELSCADLTRDIRGLCAGDVNGTYIPANGYKQTEPDLQLTNRGCLPIAQEISFPVRAEQDMELGAITLMLNFDASIMEITGVEMPDNGGVVPWFETVTTGILNIGWISLNPVNISTGQTVLVIHARLRNYDSGTANYDRAIHFSLNDNPLSELADGDGNVIYNAILSVADAGIASSVRQNNMVRIYPNPASDLLSIEYIMEQEGTCSAELMNLTGVVVAKITTDDSKAGLNKMIMNLSDVPNGAYMLNVILEDHTEVLKVIVNR